MSAPPPYPRRKHPRLTGFDYHTAGYYFVTICIHHRLPLFGSVDSATLRPTSAGVMVHEAWNDLVALHPGVAIDTE